MEVRKLRQWENLMTEYGKRQAYYRGRRRTCPGYYPVAMKLLEVRNVTMEEVITRAKQLYPELKLKPASARSWTLNELIPAPAIESLGRGRGVRAHYPVDAVAQMATVAAMMALGYTQKQIAMARKIVLEGVLVDDMPDVVALLKSGQEFHDNLAVVRMAEAVKRYALTLATARAGRKVTRPLPVYFHKRQWEQDGKQMFSCFASAVGYYIDPRGTKDITGVAADLDRQIREKHEIKKTDV